MKEAKNHKKYVTLYVNTGVGHSNDNARRVRAGDDRGGHVTLFSCCVATWLLEEWKAHYRALNGSLKGWAAAWKNSISTKLLDGVSSMGLTFQDPYCHGRKSDEDNYGLFGSTESEPFISKKFHLDGDIAPFREKVQSNLFADLGITGEPCLSDCGGWYIYKKDDKVAVAIPHYSFARNFEPHLSIKRIPESEILELTGFKWDREHTNQTPVVSHYLDALREIPDRGYWCDFTTTTKDLMVS